MAEPGLEQFFPLGAADTGTRHSPWGAIASTTNTVVPRRPQCSLAAEFKAFIRRKSAVKRGLLRQTFRN